MEPCYSNVNISCVLDAVKTVDSFCCLGRAVCLTWESQGHDTVGINKGVLHSDASAKKNNTLECDGNTHITYL